MPILHSDPFIARTQLKIALPNVEDLPYVTSQILNYQTKRSVATDLRTSTSWQDDGSLQWLSQAMLDKIAKDFGDEYQLNCCEPLIISRYERNQYYASHVDYWPTANPRCATAMLYLNDGFLGGNTYFDLLDITVRPQAGTLLYWTYPEASATAPLTQHVGMNVVGGIKYIATLWIRTQPI